MELILWPKSARELVSEAHPGGLLNVANTIEIGLKSYRPYGPGNETDGLAPGSTSATIENPLHAIQTGNSENSDADGAKNMEDARKIIATGLKEIATAESFLIAASDEPTLWRTSFPTVRMHRLVNTF